MSGNSTDPVTDDLAAALSAWHGAIARADAAFSHGAAESFEWAEAVSALDAARRLASCADAARAHLADAEKRGAVKVAQHLLAYPSREFQEWNSEHDILDELRAELGRIESGEVTP